MSPLSQPPGPAAATRRTLRLLLADECPEARRGLREHLRTMEFVDVIGEAGRDEEALDLFFRFLPQVVILSVGLPTLGGFEVLRCIKRAAPGCAVILTSRWSNSFLSEAGRLLGAAVVCGKENGFKEILSAVQRVDHARG